MKNPYVSHDLILCFSQNRTELEQQSTAFNTYPLSSIKHHEIPVQKLSAQLSPLEAFLWLGLCVHCERRQGDRKLIVSQYRP